MFDVEAIWGPWELWTECTQTCGAGKQERKRKCSVTGGCDGEDSEMQLCNEQKCPGKTRISIFINTLHKHKETT